MALVVEDGAGKSDANSYVDVAFADEYHSDRANSAWAGASAGEKEAALIKATQYLDGRYGARWVGFRGSAGQALDWPRDDAYLGGENLDIDNDVVPSQVKQATAEAALTALDSALDPDLDRGGQVKRVQVGPITQEFADSASARTERPRIDGLLRGIVTGNSSMGVTRS